MIQLKTLVCMFLITLLLVMTACAPKKRTIQIDGQDPILLAKSFNTSLVTRYAGKLSGEWAEAHFEMISIGIDQNSDMYKYLYTILSEYTTESRAKRMYVMIFANEHGMEITMDTATNFITTGTYVEYTDLIEEAISGTPKSEEYAQRDEIGNLILSAYAAIYDTKGLYVAVLGLDYDTPEFEEFPHLIK